jgi:hypothetical protein
MKSIALGRKNHLFMDSDTGGRSAAIAYTLIETAKLNGVYPQAWITDAIRKASMHGQGTNCLTNWFHRF